MRLNKLLRIENFPIEYEAQVIDIEEINKIRKDPILYSMSYNRNGRDTLYIHDTSEGLMLVLSLYEEDSKRYECYEISHYEANALIERFGIRYRLVFEILRKNVTELPKLLNIYFDNKQYYILRKFYIGKNNKVFVFMIGAQDPFDSSTYIEKPYVDYQIDITDDLSITVKDKEGNILDTKFYSECIQFLNNILDKYYESLKK